MESPPVTMESGWPVEWSEAHLVAGRDRRSVPAAILASIVIHGLVFTVLLFANLHPANQPSEERLVRTMAVTLVQPQTESGTPTETGPLEAPPAQPDQSQDQDAAGVAIQTSRAILPAPTVGITADTPAPSTPVEQPDRGTVLAMVATGMADYAVTNRKALIEQYTADCTRHRNRYGQQSDCPGIEPDVSDNLSEARERASGVFAAVTRDADQARLSRNLERENTLLRELMEQEGTASEQARIRWQLNQRNIAYLNKNVHPELVFRAQTAMVNDYNRTIIPTPFQFRCKKQPCIYNYTGFEVKRPANYVELEPSLVIKPPLFPVSN